MLEKISIKVVAILVVIIVVTVGVGLKVKSSDFGEVKGEDDIKAVLYKSPTCSCCLGHAGYLNGKGFDVETVVERDITSVKQKYNIPNNMQSCHTAVIGDYFVEGHMPVEAIEKLLSEKPDIDGISLPNMPAGSPGMPGVKKGDFVIYSLKDGESEEFMRI